MCSVYLKNKIIFVMHENRQYSTESQQSANYVHGSNIKEKDITKANNVGEKLIETEKTETGSVSLYQIINFQT